MKYSLVILLCCALVSCKPSKKVVYMQDTANGAIHKIGANAGIVVQPKDILNIIVASRNPELATAFNLPTYSYQAGSSKESYSYAQRTLGYLVDMDGSINFPILGRLKVSGLTREQVSEMIKQRLIQENFIKDAIVNTEFMNFKISVLGEVRSPGTFNISEDRITLLEALSRAGDLTIYGKRDNVLVRREKEGVVTFYRVDLRTGDFLHSPVYYLQQDDVVYVEPNNVQAAQAKINSNRNLSVWVSLASFVTSLVILIIK